MGKAKKDAEMYEVPALVVTPEKPQLVTGNYGVVENVLERWAARVSKMDLSEENLDEVQAIKRAAVSARNQLDSKVADTKKLLFNDPKTIFEARVKDLYALIAKVENKADEVLDKLEQDRRDSINEILDRYKKKFQEQYKLDDAHLSHVEYKKNYYNKTVEEKARKDDLEQQFKDLKKEQSAHAANVKLIENTCKGEPRLNVAAWVKRLAVDDVASLVEEIDAEKERLRELDKMATQTTAASSGGAEDAEYEVVVEGQSAEAAKKMLLGIPSTLDFKTDFPGLYEEREMRIKYPRDLGPTLKELFELLEPYGVKTSALKRAVF